MRNLGGTDFKLHEGRHFCFCGGGGVDGSSMNGDVGHSGGIDDSGGSGMFRSSGGGLFRSG